MYAVSDYKTYKKGREDFIDAQNKAGVPKKRYPEFKMDDEAHAIIDECFKGILKLLASGKVSGYARDSAMELIIKLVPRQTSIGWIPKIFDNDGIKVLMEIASTIQELRTLNITRHSRGHAILALNKIYEDLLGDKERQIYREKCEEFVMDKLTDDIMDSKLEAVVGITSLLEGPFDVGNDMIAKEGCLQLMLALANSDMVLHQRIAVEAIIQSTSKKDKCSALLKDGVPILKTLYQSKDDHIKVRALVGLCKLGSLGGTDASIRSMAEGSTSSLGKSCCKFLKNTAKDVDIRKWATEGLAYLTLDAEVKEDLIDDTEALKSMIDLAKTGDNSIIFPASQVFVNLTNSYDKPDILPELVELAKFSKQHVPEQHELDHEDYAKERLNKLIKAGLVTGLVGLAKTESHPCRESIARVFLAVVMEQEYRGMCVQAGGGKALIPLALDGTTAGKTMAAQALAKISITTNPTITFPGQRCLEVVRPVLQLLHPDKPAIQNFEALMALTNLASVSDTVRKRIFNEKGFTLIEHYIYEEHEMLRRASAECLCNLVLYKEAAEMYHFENDRVKMALLLCGEEDQPTVMACAGTLAVLSSNEIVCRKILDVKSWFEIMQGLASSENVNLQHRGVYILKNMVFAHEEIASRIINSTLMEVLMAITKYEEAERNNAKKLAQEALEKAMEYKLIAKA